MCIRMKKFHKSFLIIENHLGTFEIEQNSLSENVNDFKREK